MEITAKQKSMLAQVQINDLMEKLRHQRHTLLVNRHLWIEIMGHDGISEQLEIWVEDTRAIMSVLEMRRSECLEGTEDKEEKSSQQPVVETDCKDYRR